MSRASGDSIRVVYPLFQEEGGGSIPTSPLQLELREVKPQIACELNALWHSRLPRLDWSNVTRNTHYVCYAALYDGIIYAVAIWSSPVAQNRFKDGKSILELRRLAISPEAPKNTATRMLAVMIKLIRKKLPEITRLISYQDAAVHTGTIYKAAGWKNTNRTEFISWNNRPRNPDQAKAPKIRWEKNLTQ